MKQKNLIIVRGGGDLASGVVHKLYWCGYRMLVLESSHPSAIRRKVSFCDAVYDGTAEVEGVLSRKVATMEECEKAWAAGEIPLMADEAGEWIGRLHPSAVIDCILAKRNLGTNRAMAPLTIALGPGFEAGRDVDYVIETKRGHQLGRILQEGSAIADTGVPGTVAGYGKERVIHSPSDGTLHAQAQIGDLVETGQVIAMVGETPVHATLSGVLRGVIRDGYEVSAGMKIADIDPRKEERENCFSISDKARCIAGGVLEVLMSEGVLP